LNLYKALTILDQGVSASGVVTVNVDSMQKMGGDPNEAPAGAAVNDVSRFGRSLLNAIGNKPKPSRVGTKTTDGENF
jgi:hypothetical protein